MRNFIISLALALAGCASLERDQQVPIDLPDAPTQTVPDADDPPPPSDADPVPPDCEPSPPECTCNEDCDEGYACYEGQCLQQCECDFDCGNHYECHSHVCQNPHGDSPGGE